MRRIASRSRSGDSASDADELGQLILDAYRDTIDDEGETLDDAVGIVQQLINPDDPV